MKYTFFVNTFQTRSKSHNYILTQNEIAIPVHFKECNIYEKIGFREGKPPKHGKNSVFDGHTQSPTISMHRVFMLSFVPLEGLYALGNNFFIQQ